MKDTMIQQLMTAPGKIAFREIPIPVPEADQVLVKIKRIGVCGSDIHVYHGTHPFTAYPITQGHEVSGQIAALGKNVEGFHVGQRVTIEPQITCGKCYPCRHGKYNLCEELKVMGFQAMGTASEYFACPAKLITPLPDTMTFDEGAMIEPVAVAVHAVRKTGDIKGKNVVVIGAGPIGNLVFQAAKGLGAKKAMVSCRGGVRMEIARDCGADRVVDTNQEDFGQALHDTFGPDKADVIFDCAGNDTSINQAIRYARKGSQIILVAVFGKLATVDLAVLNDHEIDLNTSMMYRHEDYLEAIRLVSEGKIRLRPLMSQHFSFADYLKAYEYIDQNKAKAMKVLIDVDPDGE